MPLGRPRLERLAVVTKDRPSLLLRCLESYALRALRAGRALELCVHDDGAPSSAAALKESLQDLGRRLGTSVSYAGADEKSAYARALAEAGAPAASARFALLGAPELGSAPPIGANRNSVLLDNAGKAVFMTDDDTVCRPGRAPERGPSLSFPGRRSGVEYWFYPSIQDALEACPDTGADVLAAHEAVLGRAPRELAGALSGPPAFASEDPGLRALAASGDEVRITLNGYLGDGGASSRALPHLRGGSRRRLLASPETYETAITRRLAYRGACSLSLSDGAYFMGGFAGLDLRSWVPPPFPPLGRGEDSVFGALRWKAEPSRAVAVLPFACLHDPVPARRYPREEATGADVIAADLAAAAAFAEGGTAAALADLGLMRDLMERRARRRVEELSALPEEFPDGPEAWRRDVETARRNWEALRESADWSARDLAPGKTAAYLTRLSALLRDWPSLWQAARELSSLGTTLSRPLLAAAQR